MRACLLLLLALAGCGGDPRLDFLGSYEGSVTVDFSPVGGQPTRDTEPNGSIEIAVSGGSANEVSLSGQCALLATVLDSETLALKGKSCPRRRVALDAGGWCDYLDTIGGGTLKRGDSGGLSGSAFATGSASCNDGSGGDYSFTITYAMAKK